MLIALCLRDPLIFDLAGKSRWLIFSGYRIPPHNDLCASVASVQTPLTNSISCLVKPSASPNPLGVLLTHPYCWVMGAQGLSAQVEGATVPSVCVCVLGSKLSWNVLGEPGSQREPHHRLQHELHLGFPDKRWDNGRDFALTPKTRHVSSAIRRKVRQRSAIFIDPLSRCIKILLG